MGGQVQHRLAGRRGETGGRIDQVAAQGGTAGHGGIPAGKVPAARSRLCAITAAARQAQLAANRPDGI